MILPGRPTNVHNLQQQTILANQLHIRYGAVDSELEPVRSYAVVVLLRWSYYANNIHGDSRKFLSRLYVTMDNIIIHDVTLGL